MNLIQHIPLKMTKKAATNGGEWAGPCPWCGGRDRFRVWPEEGETGAYWCRRCDRSGDGIQLMRELHGLSFRDACERLHVQPTTASGRPHLARPKGPRTAEWLRPPGATWRARGRAFAEACVEALWSDGGACALGYLRWCGLTEDAIRTASFGYNPSDRWEPAEWWGLDREEDIWLPRGITMPWVIDGVLWQINIRRPADEPRYIGLAGSSNGLYFSSHVVPGFPVVLVEGEIDAWTVLQEGYGLVTGVATGSTHGARHHRWEMRLALASVVLVAFDRDNAGEEAARYWTDRLPNALRWRPYGSDVNEMLCAGLDVRGWIESGLDPGMVPDS